MWFSLHPIIFMPCLVPLTCAFASLPCVLFLTTHSVHATTPLLMFSHSCFKCSLPSSSICFFLSHLPPPPDPFSFCKCFHCFFPCKPRRHFDSCLLGPPWRWRRFPPNCSAHGAALFSRSTPPCNLRVVLLTPTRTNELFPDAVASPTAFDYCFQDVELCHISQAMVHILCILQLSASNPGSCSEHGGVESGLFTLTSCLLGRAVIAGTKWSFLFGACGTSFVGVLPP